MEESNLKLNLLLCHKVTTSFLPACSQLELGELLHDEMFGLFEAMSAIEMMDPKMDAGMICNRSSNTPLSFDEAVASGHVVLSKGELTWADMVGSLSCLEVIVCSNSGWDHRRVPVLPGHLVGGTQSCTNSLHLFIFAPGGHCGDIGCIIITFAPRWTELRIQS